MGFALPAAIGAAIADPNRPVFCIIGDGGMQQNVQELVTALRYSLNIKVIVVNNSGYGIIQNFQASYLDARLIATSCAEIYGARGVDFCKVAEAYAVSGLRITVDTREDDWIEAMGKRGVAVFDVIVHERHGIQPKLEFGNSLENMAPFIDSADHMIVTPQPRLIGGGWKKV
jgi:acetolactate synthase-1/2/3 large subunit